MISLFSFLHTRTAFMVVVQFRGRLVRQYRACVVDLITIPNLLIILVTRLVSSNATSSKKTTS